MNHLLDSTTILNFRRPFYSRVWVESAPKSLEGKVADWVKRKRKKEERKKDLLNCKYKVTFVAERTSYFCLARKLIWPLWSSHIFTQWGWLILFSPDNFPGQHKNGEISPNYLFLRTFRAGRSYFLSAPFIAPESQHHEESHLIYGPFESTVLDQGFPVEHE